jgi:hypothetical protein
MSIPATTDLAQHPRMANPRHDLRATEQAIHHDAKTIAELEEQKAKLEPTDPLVEQISDKVEEIAGSLNDKTAAEQELGRRDPGPTKRRRRN